MLSKKKILIFGLGYITHSFIKYYRKNYRFYLISSHVKKSSDFYHLVTIDNLNKYDFSFGPNPTENLIYLSASKNIGNVEIFNLVGQKSLSTDLRASKGALDISNLSRGIYIMNVAIDKNIGTYKLIKR